MQSHNWNRKQADYGKKGMHDPVFFSRHVTRQNNVNIEEI